jgi:hypothetical protein
MNRTKKQCSVPASQVPGNALTGERKETPQQGVSTKNHDRIVVTLDLLWPQEV